jgi:DNA-directed RNA polymerase subunit RPC12/RpoP
VGLVSRGKYKSKFGRESNCGHCGARISVMPREEDCFDIDSTITGVLLLLFFLTSVVGHTGFSDDRESRRVRTDCMRVL